MLYSKEQIEKKWDDENWRDVTWYCIDNAGHIASVSSGGGLLPQSIAEILDTEIIEKIDAYFSSLPVLSNEVFLTEEFLSIQNLQDNVQFKESNILNFTKFLSKGIYSFDKVKVMNYKDFEYYLEGKPQQPLSINDIDVSIKKIVEKTIFNGDFNSGVLYVNEMA